MVLNYGHKFFDIYLSKCHWDLCPLLALRWVCDCFDQWDIVCNFWCKVIKAHWAFALFPGYIFYWSPELPRRKSNYPETTMPWGSSHYIYWSYVRYLVVCLTEYSFWVTAFQPGTRHICEWLRPFNSPTTIQVCMAEPQDTIEQREAITAMLCPSSLPAIFVSMLK